MSLTVVGVFGNLAHQASRLLLELLKPREKVFETVQHRDTVANVELMLQPRVVHPIFTRLKEASTISRVKVSHLAVAQALATNLSLR